MDTIDIELIELLKFLLPGFVTAWVFYGLSSFPKQSQFERVVQALIFTILVEGVAFSAKSASLLIGRYYSIGPWVPEFDLVLSLIIAIALGLVVSYFANNDKLHSLLRTLNITKETSYASEWFGAFSSNVTYIVLHLSGGRRLYGWPLEWPTEAKSGHFVLCNASWILEDNTEVDLKGVKRILVRGEDVEMVEFMSPLEEIQNV